MIQGFKDKKTRDLNEGKHVKAFHGFRKQAEKRLRILDAAKTLEDLKGLSSNRLKALTGDRKAPYSIRINEQWRICFEWKHDGPHNVEITDYH